MQEAPIMRSPSDEDVPAGLDTSCFVHVPLAPSPQDVGGGVEAEQNEPSDPWELQPVADQDEFELAGLFSLRYLLPSPDASLRTPHTTPGAASGTRLLLCADDDEPRSVRCRLCAFLLVYLLKPLFRQLPGPLRRRLRRNTGVYMGANRRIRLKYRRPRLMYATLGFSGGVALGWTLAALMVVHATDLLPADVLDFEIGGIDATVEEMVLSPIGSVGLATIVSKPSTEIDSDRADTSGAPNDGGHDVHIDDLKVMDHEPPLATYEDLGRGNPSPEVQEYRKLRTELLTEYRAEQFSKAVKLGRRIRARHTVDWETLYAIAQAQRRVGMIKTSVETYREFAQRFPDNVYTDDALYWAARGLELQGQSPAARTLYRQVIRNADSDFRKSALRRLAVLRSGA